MKLLMKLLLPLLVTVEANAALVLIMNSAGNGRCWPVKSYNEMKSIIKTREPKRACQENAAAKRFDCVGAGFPPSAYLYFESKVACERQRSSDAAQAANQED
jgi:hypothetical protein